MAQKPVYKFPGTTYLINGPYIDVGSVFWHTLLVFIVVFPITLLLSWHQITIFGQVFFPLPTNNQPPAFHVKAFYLLLIGKFIPFFRGETYHAYANFILWLYDRHELGRLGWRWALSLFASLYVSVQIAFALWKPIQNEVQTRGKVLVEGDEAYRQLKKDWTNQIRREEDDSLKINPAFILETDLGYQPTKKDTYKGLKPYEKASMPDGQRRIHFLFVAGTRRGKTQIILKRIWEFFLRILQGEVIKCMIIDTPKADYSRYIPIEHMHLIAPADQNGMAWDIARDLELKHNAEEFWKGKIPDSDKDPFWNNAARGIGAGATVALINTSGDDWSYNNLVHILKLSPDQQEPLIRKHYQESLQVIQMGETTLSSVMGTNEAYTKDLLQLAEIWDGFQYKHDIDQMSVRLLKTEYEENLLNFTQKLLPMFDMEKIVDGQPQFIIPNITPNLVFKGLILYMNSAFGNDKKKRWKWSDLVEILKMPYKDIFERASKGMSKDDKLIFVPDPAKNDIAKFMETMEESFQSFSSDAEMVSYIKARFPSNRQADYIMRALIRHHGYARPWKKILASVAGWLKNGSEAMFDIVTDNLTGAELSSFINDNDHATLIDGTNPIFKWFHVWDKFETQERFSLKEWIYDENPAKKFLVLKTSGQFSALTNPLIRGMLFYAKGLIDDDGFMDDKEAGFVRQFYILMDEFQALGNVKEFVEGAFERFASKGVTVMIACQDLAQIVKLYSQEFVDFLMSNTGNIFFIGSNIGKTAEMISNALGKVWFEKLHTSITYQENGKSSSQNWQEHEKFLMTPNEVNEKLGLDVNGYTKRTFLEWLLRLDPAGLPIRYLYIGANMPKAYLLHTPVTTYKVVTRAIPADWRDPTKKPQPNNLASELKGVNTSGITAAADAEEKDRKPLSRWASSEQVVESPEMAFESMEQWESQSAEEDYQVEHDLSDEDSQKMLDVLKVRNEQMPIYILPKEEEGLIVGTIKDQVTEHVDHMLDTHALSTLKLATEIISGMTVHKTNDKQKFLEAMERSRSEKRGE